MNGKVGAAGVGMARDLALVGMIACLTAGPAAQGLADVARLAAARGPVPSSRTYTNADVEPARVVEPATPPIASSEAVPAVEADPASETETAPPAATPAPPTDEQTKAFEERRAAHARKLAGELGVRLQQRQQRVRALRKELQDFQLTRAAGNPAAAEAARRELQQSLAEAERELGSTQRAVSRATEPRNTDTGAPSAPLLQP